MSTPESKRTPSNIKPESNKPGNSTPPQPQHDAPRRKPLPYDDEPTGGAEESSPVPDTNGGNMFV
jgi:hypothetical protein